MSGTIGICRNKIRPYLIPGICHLLLQTGKNPNFYSKMVLNLINSSFRKYTRTYWIVDTLLFPIAICSISKKNVSDKVDLYCAVECIITRIVAKFNFDISCTPNTKILFTWIKENFVPSVFFTQDQFSSTMSSRRSRKKSWLKTSTVHVTIYYFNCCPRLIAINFIPCIPL